ncbi:MAG: hypothetical protein J5612_01370 [Paludibacteraceae bacterium]|nr:hypothetical protein [Paludibacteraceae bacterium]
MKKRVRTWTDRLFKGLIQLCMLTGVTFLVTACYGPMPNRGFDEEAEVEQIEDTLANEYDQFGDNNASE